MRKRFLIALICTTTVLAIWLTTMMCGIYGNTYANDINFIGVESIEDIETQDTTESEEVENSVSSVETTEQWLNPIIHKPQHPVFLVNTEEAATDEPESTQETPEEQAQEYKELYSAKEFMVLGVIWWNDRKWTWYSEKVLPGGGLDIPGRHNDDNGYVCDENDYLCVSSSALSKGTVVDTPFGKQGKVYDTGCIANVIDVYVSW